MPEFSKAFFKAKLEHSKDNGRYIKPPAHAYGCVPGRRREEAVAVQLLLGHKLRQ